MRIVIAPDKFKGSLTAAEVAAAMAAGVRRADASIGIDECPMADGGEGFVDAMLGAMGGERVVRRVTGPLPEMKLDAAFAILSPRDGEPRTAVIEMSAASGIAHLRANERDPLATTTFGTGELIVEAVRLGAKRILLGIGGSATCDAGIGCAQACGFTVLMRDGEPVSPTEPLCGRDLENVLMVKHARGEVTSGVAFDVACDVTNPLFGPAGAAPIFGPQKGASADQVKWLDDQLRAFANRSGHAALAQLPGAGAAGGLGFGMLAFFGAMLRPGIDLVIDSTKLRERLRGADLCITGEGRLDDQSAAGKTPAGVGRLCQSLGVPCVAIAGSVDASPEVLRSIGLLDAIAIRTGAMTLDQSIAQSRELLANAAMEAVRRRFPNDSARRACPRRD